MSDFEKALEFTLKWEGGYSNDPKDPGGETKFGISKKSHPDLNIKNLTFDQASEIYRKEYWGPAGCDKLKWPVNLIGFDTAVNMGVERSKKILTREGSDPHALLQRRKEYYDRLVGIRPPLKKFYNGWINRLKALAKYGGINVSF